MGGRGSKLKPKDLREIHNETLFSKEEIKNFYEGFKAKHPNGKLTKAELINIYKQLFPEGDPIPLAEQVFDVFDTDKNGFIDFKEYMCSVAMGAAGNEDQKLQVVFQVYDADNSGYITKQEFRTMLLAICKAKGILAPGSGPSAIPSDQMFKFIDENHDNRISLDEFATAVRSDPVIKSFFV